MTERKRRKTAGNLCHSLGAALLAGACLLCTPEFAAASPKEQAQSILEELPSSYDCRMAGKAPQIRSQGSFGTCWAISSLSGVEAALLPDIKRSFSADHMTLNNGFNASLSEGGDYHMILAYLSGWYGPVLEEYDPYGDGLTVENVPADVHVLEMRLLEGYSIEEFKRTILRYGPVQTSLHMDKAMTRNPESYYNKKTSAFYCPYEAKKSHDILILGWDDNFPAEAFRLDPGCDGAFVCQNTWGTDFGEKGIFYVSYADANIARSGIAYCRVVPARPDDRIYQNDVCGWQGRQGYDDETCWIANVYTALSEEILQGIGFYSLAPGTSYEIYYVRDFTSGWDLGEQNLFLAAGVLDASGYFTIDIEDEIILDRGERFAIAVKLHTPGAGKPAAVELEKDSYTVNVVLDGKESYISPDGVWWEQTQTQYGTNICLKAWTRVNKKNAGS